MCTCDQDLKNVNMLCDHKNSACSEEVTPFRECRGMSLKNSDHSEEGTPFRVCRGSAERREGP